MRRIFIFLLFTIFMLPTIAQKGIGLSGFVTDSYTGMPVPSKQIIVVLDSNLSPHVSTLHYSINSQPNGSFSFYLNNFPPSAFPLKVLVYTYDCDYYIAGYEVTYYNYVIADSILFNICTQAQSNPIDISIDSNSTACPTYLHLENSGTKNWSYLFEEYTWNINQNNVGIGNEIDYFFTNDSNSIELSAILTDSITGFIIEDDLHAYYSINFPSSYFNTIGGNVFYESLPVDKGTAILLRHYDTVYEHADTMLFDTLGYYYFTNVPRCYYSVKISEAHKGYELPVIPTYLFDQLHWAQSNHIFLQANDYQQNISLFSQQDMNGLGHVYGYILPQPEKRHDIILYNAQMEPLLYTTATENGEFEFSSLPEGSYIAYSEYYGQGSLIGTFDITSSNLNTVLYLQNYTGISSQEISNLMIFPNPAEERIFLGTTDIYSIQIYDSEGRLLIFTNETKNGIDISGLSSGIYIVKAFSEDNTPYISRFMKQ